MVLAYSPSGLTAKEITPDHAETGSPSNAIPKAIAKWYEILTMPGVAIGGGNPFLDPGAYRAPMIFQLAEAHYKVPNLYNIASSTWFVEAQGQGAALGKQFDFQFSYEHNARATALANPDYRYVDLPDEINMSDPARDVWYRQNAVVVLPGLGTSRSARTIPVPATHVAWGITLLNDANKKNMIGFFSS